MIESLKSMTIDYWYKLLAVVSIGLMVLALTVPLQVPNRQVLLLALGAFLFSLGQWINHPLQEKIGHGFKISGYPRKVHPGGLLFEVVGLCLVAWGVWKLVS